MLGRTSIQLPLAELEALPLSLPKYLTLAAVYLFPQTYEYDSATNSLTIYCSELKKAWIEFVNDKEKFDNVVKYRLLPLLDTFQQLVQFRQRYCGHSFLQDMVKAIVGQKDACDLLLNVLVWSLSTSGGELKLAWGSGAYRTPAKFTPKLAREIDFMEGVRVYPAPMLNVIEVTVKEKRKKTEERVESGLKRSVEIDCDIYALLTIGASLTSIGRGDLIYFLVPNTPDKALCEAMFNAKTIISQALDEIKGRLQDVPEGLQLLLLVSAIRTISLSSPSLTLYGIAAKDGKVDYELRVYLDEFKPLVSILNKLDPEHRFTTLTRKVARMVVSSRGEEAYAGSILARALSKLLMLAAGTGSAEDVALEALRDLENPAVVSTFSHIDLKLLKNIVVNLVVARRRGELLL